MGSADFIIDANGKDANAAFKNACDEARHEHGHGGYTGTIAEKTSFKMLDNGSEEIGEFIERLLMTEGSPVHDKWGDAGCIKVGEGEFVFFGWASE